MKKILFLLVSISVLFKFGFGQEVITGLQVNQQVKSANTLLKPTKTAVAPLALPFFDDFYKKGIYPDARLWEDNDAFISNDYAVNPPTVGVATLDAIDHTGKLYPDASEFPYRADYLTSRVIRLDSVFAPVPRRITRADSLYLSFYYQPQGRGTAPARADSLVMEFLAPDETIEVIVPADTIVVGGEVIITPADTTILEGWVKAWSAPGESLADFYAEDSTWFRQVVVPVSDSARFYTSGFKFRFRNYASLASGILPDWQGNGDQWNIDYVYLNIGRSRFDTLHRDVAFADKAPGMLRNYTSMPYNQYRANFIEEMKDSLEIKITNLDNINYNASYRYNVSRDYQEPFKYYEGGNYFIAPFIESGYVDWQPFARPPVDFPLPIGTQEKVYFTTTHVINTEANLGSRANDTIRNVQLFANYLSYDDGTAEAGYGLSATSAQMAYHFQLNSPDSLLAVQMYFNQTLKSGNVKNFYLNIWNDYFGEPGELVYSKYGYEPVYTDSLNKYFTYRLDSTIVIEPGRFPNLTFYVGWEQVTSDNLNIGFDLNNDASGHIFFRTFGNWTNSLNKGAIMIRPVLGKENVTGIESPGLSGNLKIFPNPASGGEVALGLPAQSIRNGMVTRIVTTDGRTVIQTPFVRNQTVNGLSKGMYFVQVLSADGIAVATGKLIIH